MDPQIKIIIPSNSQKYEIGLEPASAMIRASDIDFWGSKFNLQNMQLKHKTRMYPPRVKMTVKMKNPDVVLAMPIRFVGCSSDSQLDIDLIFPIDSLPSSRSSSLSNHSTPSPQSQRLLCDKQLKDIFRELFDLASNWENIGTLLGIRSHILDEIKRDESKAIDCLRKMLASWLKEEPQPTWENLAKAVERFDLLKAQDIRRCSVEMDMLC